MVTAGLVSVSGEQVTLTSTTHVEDNENRDTNSPYTQWGWSWWATARVLHRGAYLPSKAAALKDAGQAVRARRTGAACRCDACREQRRG